MKTPINRRDFLKLAGGALLAAGAASVGNIGLVERYDRTRLPPAPALAPNVLLIVLDAVRAQNLSLYGYHRPTTPNLERLAKKGVVFDRAIATTSWTLPSHASMFTGRWQHELSTNWTQPLDATYPTLAEALSAQGYLTGGFVANTLYCSYEMGLSRGFIHYDDFLHGLTQAFEYSGIFSKLEKNLTLRRQINNFELPGRKSAKYVNEELLDWLSHRGERPFFGFINYFDAHDPYLPPEPFDKMFGTGVQRENPWIYPKFEWTQEQVQAEMAAYDGAIAYIDHQIGVLFDQLTQQRLLENTLVIIVGDHGEQFGEHNLMGHGNSLYIQTLQVPLLMILPQQVPVDKRISSSVSLRDLPATVLDLLGLRNERGFPGQSLARYWDAAGASNLDREEMILSEITSLAGLELPQGPLKLGDMQSLVKGEYHYICNGDGSEELYNIEVDPLENANMVRSGSKELESFRAALKSDFNY